MDDPRWKELATLFYKSTQLKEGDHVMLQATDLESLPLISALYKVAVQKGAASINYSIVLPEFYHFFLKHGSEKQIQFLPEWEMEKIKKMDVFIGACGETNGYDLNDIPAEKISLRSKTVRPLVDERVRNTRWCVTDVPTDYNAILAEMSTHEYFDYYFQACLQDYEAMKVNNQALKDLMEKTDRVKIIAEGTLLEFSIKDIGVQSCYGNNNIPDGEVFTAPVKESVEGVFSCNIPSFQQGREWSNIRLTFLHGRIVDAKCDQGEEAINKIFDIDNGARYIGEFAIGTNKGIKRASKNTLFDEKMLGSFHFTPGNCYGEACNGNRSAIHWDLVKAITPQYGGGLISFDGVSVIEDGLFIHPDLLGLNP